MKSEIISIGTELLLGNTVNTNATFLSEELAKLGIDVYYHTVVGDNHSRLKETLLRAMHRSDLIIMTGGLGPTSDDITKEVAAEAAGRKLLLSQTELDRIRSYFGKTGRIMTDNNIKQAYVPEGATAVVNHNGTAPGIIMETKNTTIIMLPGPPSEMKAMFKNDIIPYLKRKSDTTLFSKTIKFFGIGESSLEDALKDLIDNQTDPTIAPYAGEGEVKLRITTRTNGKQQSDAMAAIIDTIEKRVGKYIYAYDEQSLEQVVAQRLLESGLTVAVAESCTGGRISSLLTSVPGISKAFLGGVISYSNDVKKQILNVSQKTLEKYGAVSSQTALEMASGVKRACEADIGLSTTGIAGPTGDTPDKPVGLVYIALDCNEGQFVWERRFRGNREKIQSYTAKNALNYLRLYLIQKASGIDNISF
jgi:nicotinamide-nucleotide amidase